MLKKTLTELKMSTLGRFERDLELWKANNSLTIFSSLVKEAESTYEWTISTLLGWKGQEGQRQEGDGMGEESYAEKGSPRCSVGPVGPSGEWRRRRRG